MSKNNQSIHQPSFWSSKMYSCWSFCPCVMLVILSILSRMCNTNPISSSILLSTGSGLAGLAPFGITTSLKTQSQTQSSQSTSPVPYASIYVTTIASTTSATMAPSSATNSTRTCPPLSSESQYRNCTYSYCCTRIFDYSMLGLGWQLNCKSNHHT